MENKHLNSNELNPRRWLLYILIVVNIVISVVLANKVVTNMQNKSDKESSIFNDFFDSFNEAVNNVNNNSGFSEIEKSSFNSTFEMYSGTEYGTSVAWLIDKVVTNNKTNSEHIITFVFGDINTSDSSDEIRNIKKSLDDWTKYEVILDYDDNGFVYLITIE